MASAGPSRLVEVYELAAQVHQVLERFSVVYGTAPIERLIPEIKVIFEQLEHLMAENATNRTNQIKDELTYVLAKTDSIRRKRVYLGEKFDHDLNNIIQQWREETGSLQLQIVQLRDEVEKLSTQLANRRWDARQCEKADSSSGCNDEVFSQVRGVVMDIKKDISKKEEDLTEVHKELDVSVMEMQRAVDALQQTKDRNRKLQEDKKKLEQERNELMVALAALEQQLAFVHGKRLRNGQVVISPIGQDFLESESNNIRLQ